VLPEEIAARRTLASGCGCPVQTVLSPITLFARRRPSWVVKFCARRIFTNVFGGKLAAVCWRMSNRPRVLVALPDLTESAAVADWLSDDGLEPVRRSSPRAAAEDIQAKPFALMIADAGWAASAGLPALLRGHNPQSFSLLIGDTPAGAATGGHVSYLSRPLDRAALSCFVWMEINDRRPFRRSIRKPVNRFEAIVNGVPSHIVDVSSDGLRLEMPRDNRIALPPAFTVRVPLMGVAIVAQRMWMRTASNRGVWYGGALAPNRPSAAQGWRAFVDMVPVVGEKRVVAAR
jgi:hypothetical protein